MRFLTYIECDPAVGPPPPELFEALGAFSAEMSALGVVVDRGGLAPVDGSTHIRVSGGGLTVTDGPFAEAKEVIGGYAMYDVRSKEEVLEYSRRFMQLHVDAWPGFEGTAVIREVFGPYDGQE
ncbi:MAG: YCII-related [Aeromicrobium sp.]|nr:YCII-related [Aeromicrobium sp.]